MNSVNFLFFDFIFLFISIFYLPYYILKKKSLKDILARIKHFPLTEAYFLSKPIWIHAVSVGEVMAIKNMVEELKKCYPQKKIILTTVTSTGRKMAERFIPVEDIYFLPLDLSFLMRIFVKRINPSLLIIAETELWPNLIISVKQKNIPIVLVNARISPSSFRRYLLVKHLIYSILKRIDLFLVQTELDKDRFLKLGVSPHKIKVCGNMKFDILLGYKISKGNYVSRDYLGIKPDEKLLLAGSTHSGEEEFVLEVFKRLKTKFFSLRLLLAPRHIERAYKIADLVEKEGFTVKFISKITEKHLYFDNNVVFILDILGRLLEFYSMADIVYVGGSLVKRGGHNILEPALFKKPILFGPYMFNFQDISEQFLKENAALLVKNQEEFYKAVEMILEQPQRGIVLGENAYNLLQKNQGVTQRYLKWINSIFSGI